MLSNRKGYKQRHYGLKEGFPLRYNILLKHAISLLAGNYIEINPQVIMKEEFVRKSSCHPLLKGN